MVAISIDSYHPYTVARNDLRGSTIFGRRGHTLVHTTNGRIKGSGTREEEMREVPGKDSKRGTVRASSQRRINSICTNIPFSVSWPIGGKPTLGKGLGRRTRSGWQLTIARSHSSGLLEYELRTKYIRYGAWSARTLAVLMHVDP